MKSRLLLAIMVYSVVAIAQTIITGDVAGVASDTSGAVVPGATVTLKNVGTNESRTLVTDLSASNGIILKSKRSISDRTSCSDSH